MNALVQIEDLRTLKRAQVMALPTHRLTRKRVAQVEELIAASGLHALCGRCIRKELPENPFNGGCCTAKLYYWGHEQLVARGDWCVMLGPNGCERKPLGCALFLCAHAQNQFPKLAAQVAKLRTKYYRSKRSSPIMYYSAGLQYEAELARGLAKGG